jgi:hypothetical protein
MKEFDDLTVQVRATTDAETAAAQAFNGIAAKYAALVAAAAASGTPIDPAAITALTNQLKASADSMAADVVANTPAA